MAPIESNGMLVDSQWRQWSPKQAPFGIGVPRGLDLLPGAALHGFLSYEAAMALAWWFLSNTPRLGLEVHLVEHTFTSVITTERNGVLATMRSPMGELMPKVSDEDDPPHPNGGYWTACQRCGATLIGKPRVCRIHKLDYLTAPIRILDERIDRKDSE